MIKLKNNKEGFIYISYGSECNQECETSINSLLKVHPDADITVFSDNFYHERVKTVSSNRSGCPWLNKIQHMSASPYGKTCYLDTDTYFLSNCSDGFKLLNYFDGCMVPAPAEVNLIIDGKEIEGSQPYNSGVFFYNRSVIPALKKAHALYSQKFIIRNKKDICNGCGYCYGDQAYISYSLMMGKKRIHNLPNTWNFRVPYYMNLNGYVKIIHANLHQLRFKTYEQIASIVNYTDRLRMWDSRSQRIFYD